MAKIIELKPASYTITSNSRLDGKLFTGAKSEVTKIIGPFRKGTLSTEDNVPPNGNVTLKPNTRGLLEFAYIPKENFIGDDSLEFKMEFANGEVSYQIIDILVKEKMSKANVNERYIDVFFDDISQIKFITTIESKYKLTLDIPTTLSYSSSSSDFRITDKTSFHDLVNSYGSIINGGTRTQIETCTKVVSVENKSTSTFIRAIPEVEFTISKDPNYYGNEYGILRFKDFVNKELGHTSNLQEFIYINWKLRTYDYDYDDSQGEISVPDFKEPIPPEFIYPEVNYPIAPKQSAIGDPKNNRIGETFAGTKSHQEKDERGNNTIRIGKKVPDDAVNLGYYFNTTAGIKDTVSVIETNMNNVTLHYVNDWVHKRNLPNKDENLFPDFIEFEGEEGSELEGYWGILYREYVMWEEQTMKDLDPQIKTVYQEYRGLKTDDKNNIPIIWNYNDDDREGKLELTNTIIEALDYFDNGDPRTFVAFTKYEGLTTKKRIRYHGSAKYGGVVTKKDGMANIDPDQPKEIIMYPDDFGLLYRENGDPLIDDDLFCITDKFKDGVPLYYKHRLKHRIYDSVGPDKYGVYKTSNIKLILENNYEFDEDKYKYKVCVEPTEWKNIYDVYVYTSFVPTTETPVYVTYDGMPQEAYIGREKINPINAKVGIVEKISVYPAIHKSKYKVDKLKNITKQSTITMNEIKVIKDERAYIPIEYVIMADDMESATFSCKILNCNYAITNEKDLFINGEMIVSTKSVNGFMTAKDMFLKTASQEQIEKLNEDTVFRLRFNNKDTNTFVNKEKVIMYTDPGGGGLVMAKTYVDTGFPNEMADNTDVPKMNKMVTLDHTYLVKDGKIYKGYAVMCKNINQITIHPPIENNPLKSWLPAINYSYFNKAYERIDKTIQLIYSVPEFYNQIYGDYGRPYVDVKSEIPRNLGNGVVKVSRYPIYIEPSVDWAPKNIVGRKVLPNGIKRLLTVKNYNFEHGIIEFEDKLSDNDLIEIDYTYEEKYYHYRGYYENSDPTSRLIDINLNPNMYNFYTDTKNELYQRANVYNLFNRTIHFFLRPMRVIDKSNGEVIEDNHFTLYHRIDKPDAISPFDLHVGRIFIRHHTSLKSTKLIDTRSRGGGVLKSISDDLRRELEPESDYYLDIGTLDGKPYHENSVVVIKVDERVLIQNGGRFSEHEVRESVEKWSAFGMFPIIEYIKVLHDDELPQNTLEVTTEVENTIKFRPYIETIAVEV